MKKKVLEVLNQFLTLSVYSFLLFNDVIKGNFNLNDNLIALGVIIISVIIMFYGWSLKE